MFKGVITEEEALKDFNERIIGMMRDYSITMSEALWWDFEGFFNCVNDLYRKGGFSEVENKFVEYLLNNNIIRDENIEFYRDIFTGKSNDLELKRI